MMCDLRMACCVSPRVAAPSRWGAGFYKGEAQGDYQRVGRDALDDMHPPE